MPSVSNPSTASNMYSTLGTTLPEKYQHRRLESPSTIRLLKILPDLVNDRIACTLQHVDTDEFPETTYSALSYCFGDPTHTRTVYLGDAGDDPALPVRLHELGLHENLWGFLDQMHHQMKQTGEAAFFLWTDFLCLDQLNEEELSEQVSRMGKIYSSATRTISWLGRPQRPSSAGTPSSGTATGTGSVDLKEAQMDWIAKWVADKQELIDRYDLRSLTWLDNDTSGLAKLGISNVSSFRPLVGRAFISMANILGLPYWTRVWIVQEVALAKRVDLMFGSKIVDSAQFVLLYKAYSCYHLRTASEYHMRLFCIKPAIQARERLTTGKMPLWEILRWGSRCKSSRIVDKVYGLIGLLKYTAVGEAQLISHLEADYGKDPSQVYWDIAFGCFLCSSLEETGSLDEHYLPGLDPYACRWESFRWDDFTTCSVSLEFLRRSLSCPSSLETLQAFAESARPPQQLMTSVALRLATACRAMGRFRNSYQWQQGFQGPEPRPAWRKLCPSQISLETYLLGNEDDGLGVPERVQAAIIGVSMEANYFGPGRWVCLADEDVESWPSSAQKYNSTMRFESLRGAAPQCCLHQPGQNRDPGTTQQECIGSRLFLSLPEIGCVLKYEVEWLEPDPEWKRCVYGVLSGVLCIAFDRHEEPDHH